MPPTPADAASRPWLDEGEPDPTWAPPTPAETGSQAERRRPRTVLVAVALVVAAALLVGLVWRLGGFDARRDEVTDAPVGALLTTGPYQLRFTSATAQLYTDLDKSTVWRVTMIGEGLTTANESMAPSYSSGEPMFAAKDPESGELLTKAYAERFSPDELATADHFTPGLPLQPLLLEFRFSQAYRPGDTILFVVYDLEYRDTSLLGNQDPVWATASTAHRLRLPVKVLPSATT